MQKDNEEKDEMDDSVVDDNSHFYEGSSILESREFNDTERDIMKGDTIGDTVYSSKWVINTLISLSKVCEDGWSKDLEEALCTLWDMTGEKDVVHYLLENDFFKMAEFTLKVSSEPRLTEIIVGIVGNICCEKEGLDKLEKETELTSIILHLLQSDDPETLVQVLRILQTVAWHIQQNSNFLWLTKLKDFNFIGDTLTFILNSSTKDDLLMGVLDFASSISQLECDALKDLFKIEPLFPGLLESITQILQIGGETYSSAQLKSINNWLSIIKKITKMEFLTFSDDEDDTNFNNFTNILYKIMRPYRNSLNLIPLNEQNFLCIQRTVEIVLICQRNEFQVDNEIIWIIIHIMSVLHADDYRSEIKYDVDCAEKALFNYLANYWIEILSILSREELLNTLENCDKTFAKELMKISKSRTSADKIEKLQEILSCLKL